MTTPYRERVAAEQQQRTEEIHRFLDDLDKEFQLPSWEEIDAGTDVFAHFLRHLGLSICRLRKQGYLQRDMDTAVVKAWLNNWADAIEAGSNATP